jgi:hypothetical protein
MQSSPSAQPARNITVTFHDEYDLNAASIRLAKGAVGIYFIYLKEVRIPYPFQSSRLIYIGMSESKQNSVGNRLHAHRTGQSGNLAIQNYAERYATKFTYQSLQALIGLGTANIHELETFFLNDFLRTHGAFPLCNNQSGMEIEVKVLLPERIGVAWGHFA